MTTAVQSSREQWEQLSTDEIWKYLDKYGDLSAPGKCSTRRRKKVRYLKAILQRRIKAQQLISGVR